MTIRGFGRLVVICFFPTTKHQMVSDQRRSAAQKAAEETVEGFRQGLGPFVVAAETTRMPMMFTNAKDAAYPVIFVNEAFLNLTGYEEHEVLGEGFYSLMERGTDPEMLAEIRTSFAGGRGLEPTVRYRRKDESAIWVQLFITPARNKDGDVVQHFESFIDVTRLKESEDQLLELRRARSDA